MVIFLFSDAAFNWQAFGARTSYISQIKEITTPPSWTKAFKNNSSLYKFFLLSNAQRKSNIWTTSSYSAWQILQMNESLRAEVGEDLTCLLSKLWVAVAESLLSDLWIRSFKLSMVLFFKNGGIRRTMKCHRKSSSFKISIDLFWNTNVFFFYEKRDKNPKGL